MRKLRKDESACNSYIQNHPTCNKCLRNIAFFSNNHQLWTNFEAKVTGSLEIECDGFVEKTEVSHINDFEVEG